MQKTISLIVLGSWIASVATGMGLALAAERALNLSDPHTIALIMGKYEGRSIDRPSSRNGSLFVTFAVNPHGGEKPFYREAKVVGASTIDPNKASPIEGKIDQNTLAFSHASEWSKYTFYGENGQIKARGEYRYETGPMGGTWGIHELVKVGEVSRAAELTNG